ncbi:MAG TPA: PD-(D/E)XK nuclease family protein [Pseudonocardia sp.]|nr:PD-(D/E)XK nuclease family protein [Pseudonocardia sp.]
MTTSVVVSGYGAPALEQLRLAVAWAKAADPMTQVTVLAPSNIAGVVARRHLARGSADRPGIAGIEVTTLVRLAERIAAPLLVPRRPATRTVLAAAWRRALDESPGRFAEIAGHPATVRALVRAHADLRDLSDGARTELTAVSPLCADLVRLHLRVQSLVGGGWYDGTDVLVTARRHVRGSALGSVLGSCVLFLPQELTRAESAFAGALGEDAELTVIAGLTGVRRADRAVHRLLETLGMDRADRPAIRTATTVINSSDSDDEVRCVVRDLMSTLRTTPAHRVAVLHTHPVPYARLLHEQLAAAGVRVNGAGYRAADERAVGRFLLQVLVLGERGLPRADLFRALSAVPSRSFDGERIPIAPWERMSRTAGVVGGEDWDRRLSAYITDQAALKAEEQAADEPQEWVIRRCEQQAAIAADLRGFGLRLADELAREFSTWAELGEWAERLLTTLIGELESLRTLPAEEQYAATTVVTILRGLAALDDVGVVPSLQGLRDVLETELAGARARVGRYGEGVFVGPVSAAVGLDLDVVYVLGLSEDLYPGRVRGDALLPDRARRATGGELPDQREDLDTRHRQLLAAFGAAPRVVASFARGDLRRSSNRLPSRWLLPSLRELSGDKALPASEWDRPENYGDAVRTAGSFAGELSRCPDLGTEQEWRVRQVSASGVLDDPVLDAGVEMVRARASDRLTRFDGNLAGVEGLPDFASGDQVISPTALESYADCPHSFFVQRLLGVKPLELPEDIVVIAPSDIGKLVHECMDALVVEYAGRLPGAGQPWTPEQRSRLLQIFAERAAWYEDRGLTGHPRLWAPERRRIAADSVRMLDDDDAWRAERGVEVIASEMAFGMKGRPPVTVEIPGGRVSFRGSADLVGRASDGTLMVIDIKTGSDRTFKPIKDDPVCAGTKLQLPVYAHAARQQFGDPSTPVEASYWFVRRDLGRVPLDLTPELERTYAHTISTLVRSVAAGLFPLKAPEEPDFLWVQCDYCNPDGIGHAENRTRWERKRRDPVLKDLVALVDPHMAEEVQV